MDNDVEPLTTHPANEFKHSVAPFTTDIGKVSTPE